MVIQGVSYLSDFEAKKAIMETAKRLEAKGFLTAGDGSLSVRVGPNAVWVTVDGADKANLTQDMLVRVDLNGKANLSAHPKPLGEDLPIHLKLYRENENVQCVLHAYPPCAAVLGQQGQGLDAAGYSPSARKLGRIEFIAGLTGEALAKAVAARSRTDKGVLLENDGCMFWAKAPVEVCHLAEALNYRFTVDSAIQTAAHSACSCVGCQGCGGCTGSTQCDKCAGCTGTNPAPPEPPRSLAGVTALIQPGQPLPPLPQQRQEQSAAPVEPAPPAVSAADAPKDQVMAEVVRRVLQSF